MNPSFLLCPARVAAVATVLAVLAACGGGTDAPAVTSLQASPAMFGQTTTVQVQGANLQNVTASIEPGCTTMTRGAAGTDTFQSFSCRISWLGDLRVRVRSEGGAELAALRLDIPLPQVTFIARHGTGAGAPTGTFTVELDPEKTPGTVDNFLAYVNQSTCFYRDTLFHRIDTSVGVVEAGGYTANLTTKEGKMPPIVLETNRGLSNLRGTIAMARTAGPNSATSEFYINTKDNPALDYASPSQPGYAVFGKVVGDGMTDIDRLATVPTTQKGQFPTAPVTEVTITSCRQTK
jgi:cyclophilin family peptidyl-prolyl cis-trans isomerase